MKLNYGFLTYTNIKFNRRNLPSRAGDVYMMNVHMLIHIADVVNNWGDLCGPKAVPSTKV